MFDIRVFTLGFACGAVFVGFLLIVLGKKVSLEMDSFMVKLSVFLMSLTLIYAVLPFLEGILFFIAVTILSIGVVLISLWLNKKIDK